VNTQDENKAGNGKTDITNLGPQYNFGNLVSSIHVHFTTCIQINISVLLSFFRRKQRTYECRYYISLYARTIHSWTNHKPEV